MRNDVFTHSFSVSWVIVGAQIWVALLQWRDPYQNVFRLLRCSHEPDSVRSQLWRLAAPSRTGAQAQQHSTKKQGQQCCSVTILFSTSAIQPNLFRVYFYWTGGCSESATISDPAACWDWAADAAGSHERRYGRDWWAAPTRATAEWYTLCSVRLKKKEKSLAYEDCLYELHTTAGTPEEQTNDSDPPRSDLFLFPDESGNCQDASPPYPMLASPLITPAPSLAQETDDFCILESPDSRGEVGMYSCT